MVRPIRLIRNATLGLYCGRDSPPRHLHITAEGSPIQRFRSVRPARILGVRSVSRRSVAAAVCAAVVGWVAYAVYAESSHGHSLDSTVTRLQQQNDALRKDIETKQREISAAGSPAWLEEEARRLGYVKPGETVYVIATPGATVPAGGGIPLGPLPTFAASPSPGAARPTAAPPSDPFATPQPTPFTFSVGGGH